MEDEETEEWDSGPYCRHWHDYYDCDTLCVCGHKCCEHPIDGCDHEGCDCQDYKDKEE